jgi:hypothetical protein
VRTGILGPTTVAKTTTIGNLGAQTKGSGLNNALEIEMLVTKESGEHPLVGIADFPGHDDMSESIRSCYIRTCQGQSSSQLSLWREHKERQKL